MEHKYKNALTEYYKHFGICPIEYEPSPIGSVQIYNPGIKCIESIEAKIKLRKKINDIARCAVLTDSFQEVPNILVKLKEKVSKTIFRVIIEDFDYKAIHANFETDGVSCEIQFHTKKTWAAKLAEDINYKKWFYKHPDSDKEKLQKEIDMEITAKLYALFHEDGDFDRAKSEILETIEELNRGSQEQELVPILDVDKMEKTQRKLLKIVEAIIAK